MFEYSFQELSDIAGSMLDYARELGATEAKLELSEGSGFSVMVRCLEVETIEQTRGKGFVITLYHGKRSGHASSTDFSMAALRQTVEAAWQIARFTAEDEYAGLPEPDMLAVGQHDPEVFHEWPIAVEEGVLLAKQVEQAAFDCSSLIANSDGASVGVSHNHFLFANTLGFLNGYRFSRHSLSCVPIAKRNTEMQRDGWDSTNCNPGRLANPVVLGQYAAARTLSRLGARRLATCKVPVLFEAPLACGLLGHFVQATSGGALYRHESFLTDSLEKQIFPPAITIEENPFLPGEAGSAPFDAEGVRTMHRKVVYEGVLRGYFLSTYSARKLNMRSTGNAGGSHNLSLLSRETCPDDGLPEMLKKLGTGLFVTDLMGHGVNYVTGDYSRGASGFWVENGQIQYPVEEVTIAGNLRGMFQGILAVGADVLVRGKKRSGSVLLSPMSVAGQ